MSREEAARFAVIAEFGIHPTLLVFGAEDWVFPMADEIVRLRAELARVQRAQKGLIDPAVLREGGVM